MQQKYRHFNHRQNVHIHSNLTNVFIPHCIKLVHMLPYSSGHSCVYISFLSLVGNGSVTNVKLAKFKSESTSFFVYQTTLHNHLLSCQCS